MLARYILLTLMMCIASLAAPARQVGGSEGRSVEVIRPRTAGSTDRIPNFLPYSSVVRPKVALVLSGGGARGIASVGVLEVLEQAEIPIDLVVGTSMGSIIGGLYAAGYSTEQLRATVDSTDWTEILSFSDEARRSDQFLDQKIAADRSILTVRFKEFEPILPQALSTGQRLTNYLNLLVLQGIYHPNPSFDDLRVPFRAVTTDLVSGESFVLDRGDLTEALRASVSVPLLFSPVPRDTTQLLDGGLVVNIPVDIARSWGADIVVVVDVTSPLRPASKLKALWEIADQVLGITMQSAKRDQLAKADLVITPKIGAHLSDDFTNLDSLILQGREAARGVVDELRSLIRRKSFETERSHTRDHVFANARLQFDPLTLEQRWLTKLLAIGRESDVPEFTLQSLVNEMYETGDFESVEIEVQGSNGNSALKLRAQPNPVVKTVEISGNRYVGLDTLKAVFEPLIGRRLNFHESRKAMESILAIYRDRGYSLARIRDAKLDRSSGVASIFIDEGVVYRRDIQGTTKTKDYVLWRELLWEQGDVFHVARIAEGIARLYGTNLFEQVSVSVHQEGYDNEHQIVVINVRERKTELIRFGLRVDNERNIQPSIDIRDENLFGIGAELGVHVFGGSRNMSYEGEFKVTRIFNSYFTVGLSGYYTYRDVNVYADEPLSDPKEWNRVWVGEYRELRQGGSITFGTQLERLGTVTAEGRLENHRVWNISGLSLQTESFRIGSIKFGLKIDNQDRYPFPRNGLLMDFSYESAFLPAKGGAGFTKMSFSSDWYQTYFQRHTLHPRIRFGFADETLPITEQFSLGGQQSFFGLREDNSRGRQLLVASLEYRYQSPFRIFFDTYLTARYDLGSIWAAPAEIRIKNLRHGIGVGLAFDTPIGLAEFSVGRSFYFRRELLNNPISLGPTLGYFSIGYAF